MAKSTGISMLKMVIFLSIFLQNQSEYLTKVDVYTEVINVDAVLFTRSLTNAVVSFTLEITKTLSNNNGTTHPKCSAKSRE